MQIIVRYGRFGDRIFECTRSECIVCKRRTHCSRKLRSVNSVLRDFKIAPRIDHRIYRLANMSVHARSHNLTVICCSLYNLLPTQTQILYLIRNVLMNYRIHSIELLRSHWFSLMVCRTSLMVVLFVDAGTIASRINYGTIIVSLLQLRCLVGHTSPWTRTRSQRWKQPNVEPYCWIDQAPWYQS